MGLTFYNLFLFLYSVGIRVTGLWSPKARKWAESRKNNFATIETELKNNTDEIVWFHCASLGEFEQGLPLMKEIKIQKPTAKIVLTFFSPSGYEAVSDRKDADYVFYLPMDSFFSAKKFIDLVNPVLVIWVKYEFWYYYLKELKKRNIPVLLVSAVFRKNQPFFKWYGAIWKKMLESFHHIFVQNEGSKKILETIASTLHVTVVGDTRFDRVIEIAGQHFEFPLIDAFSRQNNIIVAGSTWEDDEIILSSYADETKHREKIILVPHELDKAHLDVLSKMFKKSIFYSEIENKPSLINNLDDYDTMIIDKIGMLSRLYSYGFINYVGGGFTADGIHNILEAAVWGKPIIIGENFDKYIEAIDLVDCLAAESISNTNELKKIMTLLINNKTMYTEAANAAKEYVFNHGGAVNKITRYIYVNRLLTN